MIQANPNKVVHQINLGQAKQLLDNLIEAQGVPITQNAVNNELNQPVVIDPEPDDETVVEEDTIE